MVEKVEQCGVDVFNFILTYYRVRIEKKVVIKTVYQLISVVTQHVQLNFRIYIPCYFFINPKWFLFANSFVSREKLFSLLNEKNGVLVHYADCTQLYKINDVWLHFICGVFESGRLISLFDPYEMQLIEDYEIGEYSKLDYDNFLSSHHVMIFFYR